MKPRKFGYDVSVRPSERASERTPSVQTLGVKEGRLQVSLTGASLSNTVEQIRPVNGLTRLVRPVQVVKQRLTGGTGRGTMVTCISLVRPHFNQDSTTRTGREAMVHESYNW